MFRAVLVDVVCGLVDKKGQQTTKEYTQCFLSDLKTRDNIFNFSSYSRCVLLSLST